MRKHQFTLSDITADMREHTDQYIKRVLINKKKRYFRRLKKLRKNGITILELEKYETNLIYEQPQFNNVEVTCFIIGEHNVEITKSELADAMRSLTELQLQILIRLEVLNASPEELSNEYGISKRMIRKHRQIALEKLRKKMGVNNEK